MVGYKTEKTDNKTEKKAQKEGDELFSFFDGANGNIKNGLGCTGTDWWISIDNCLSIDSLCDYSHRRRHLTLSSGGAS